MRDVAEQKFHSEHSNILGESSSVQATLSSDSLLPHAFTLLASVAIAIGSNEGSFSDAGVLGICEYSRAATILLAESMENRYQQQRQGSHRVASRTLCFNAR